MTRWTPQFDILTVPDDVLLSESARRLRMRQVDAPRPKVLRPCPYCLQSFGARELRDHRPICPNRHNPLHSARAARTIRKMASKYIWWKTPDEAAASPERVLAQVMNIGDYDDVQTIASQIGNDALRDVLTHAEIGQFNQRSWFYWHYRLGLATLEHVPPMPTRRLS
jgi:hypothetical protein